MPSPRPRLHHFGVAGDHLHAALGSGFGDGIHNPLQVRHRQPLLQDKAQTQVPGGSAAHGQIVDRSADAELSDVTAWEKVRADHVTVSGEHQVSLVLQNRTVAQGGQGLVLKGGDQQFLNEAGGLFAAAAVVQCDDFFQWVSHCYNL